ncbi:hypothetical protein GOODEAATRI_019937, partial [Goodea atripinnis]
TPPPDHSPRESVAYKCIIFLWVLTSSVAVALGGLTLWHAKLISRGETSVERHINRKEARRLREKGKVCFYWCKEEHTRKKSGQRYRDGTIGKSYLRSSVQSPVVVFRNPYHHGRLNNWKLFFGVETRSHWLTRVLLPSSHLPSGDGITWDCTFTRSDPVAI